MLRKTMKAGQFKAECLKIMDEVQRTQVHFVITKRNVPVAELIPINQEKKSAFGLMKGTIQILGDIIAPIDEEWNASR